MEIMPDFVDMKLSPQEQSEEADCGPMTMEKPIYPYGLCISFTEEELEKLALEDDAEVGDMVMLHCIAKVTSVSSRDTTEGTKKRIEMQIVAIKDDAEEEPEEPASTAKPLGRNRPY